MLKKLLNNVFKKNDKEPKEFYLIAQINEKIMPVDRGEVYQDPLDEFLKANRLGEVSGGGTLQEASGEIKHCDIEILLKVDELNKDILQSIINKLEALGVPKGSKLIIESTSETIEFGNREGIAIYLDGVNLPDHVYLECDSNYVADELTRLIGDNTEILRYWQGDKETAFYFYGKSFSEMNATIQDFIDSYPLCQGARVVQVA